MLMTKRSKHHIPDIVHTKFVSINKIEIRINKPALRPVIHTESGQRGRLHVFYIVPKSRGWRGDLAVVTVENRYCDIPCNLLDIDDFKGVIPKKFRKLFKSYHTNHRNKKGEYEILEREV